MRNTVLFFALLVSMHSFAQDRSHKVWPHIHLGNDTGAHTTSAAILGNPILTDLNSVAAIYHFSISFESKGNVYGPYYTTGSSLTEEEIDVIKKLKGTHTRIVIDDIKVKVEGFARSVNDLSLSFDN